MTVNSITDLRATVATISDPTCTVLGYATAGDEGGGDFYWDSTAMEPDNNGTIIMLNTGTPGRWKRVYSGAVNVTWFGAKGDGIADDDAAIQAAINVAGEEGSVLLPGEKKYKVSNVIKIKKGLTVQGYGATVVRANETTCTLTVATDPDDMQLTVDAVPANWKVGDNIHVYLGVTRKQTSSLATISGISGNVISLQAKVGGIVNGISGLVFPIGTKVRKVFTLFSGQQYPQPEPAHFLGIKFDGNKANNTGNDYWYFNTCLSVFGKGTLILDCEFINMPNETIVTSGGTIMGCRAYDLRGSFVHLSSANQYGADTQGTIISNNYVDGVCQATFFNSGHCEGAITMSWNAGKTSITGNRFSNGATFPVNFCASQDAGIGDGDEFLVTGNYFKGFNGIEDLLLITDKAAIKSRVVTNNVYDDCSYTDFTDLPNIGGIRFFNNTFLGNTNVIGSFNMMPVMTGLVNNGNASFQNGVQGFTGAGSVEFDKPAYFDKIAKFRYQPIFEKSGQTNEYQGALYINAPDGGNAGLGLGIANVGAKWLYMNPSLDLMWQGSKVNHAGNTKGGVYTANGNGVLASFSIAHGLGGTPASAVATASTVAAQGFTIDYNSTHIVVNYVVPPPAGTGNVKLTWIAIR